MNIGKSRGPLALVVGVLVLGLLGCPPANTKYKDAEQSTKPAVVAEAHPGGDFNKYFPKAQDGYDVVFDQEKKGAALASLKKDGKVIATISITDAISTPDTVKEYEGVTEKINDKYPLRAEGKKAHSVLVAGRYQVKVRNDAEADFQITEDARKDWLKKFDLDKLSELK